MALPLQIAMDSNSWKRGMWVHPNCVEWNTPNCLRGHLLQTYCATQKDNRQLDSVVTRESESSVAKVSLKRRAKDAWQFVKVERGRWEEGSRWTWFDIVGSGHCRRKLPPAWTEHPPVGCLHPARGCPRGLVHRDPFGMCGALWGVLSPDVGQWVVGSGRSSPDAGTTVCPTQKMEEPPLPPMGLLVTHAAWGWFGALCVSVCDLIFGGLVIEGCLEIYSCLLTFLKWVVLQFIFCIADIDPESTAHWLLASYI